MKRTDLLFSGVALEVLQHHVRDHQTRLAILRGHLFDNDAWRVKTAMDPIFAFRAIGDGCDTNLKASGAALLLLLWTMAAAGGGGSSND